MNGREVVDFSDADAAELDAIVSEIERTQAVLVAAQVAQTRALARAGDLARVQGARSRSNVRIHDMALRAIAAEVGGVLRVTDRSVQRQIGEAIELVEQFPSTVTAWERGEITRGHVRVITETAGILPVETKIEFETEALRRCEQETPGRVRGELELLAERLHPRSLADRHREAKRHRNVRVLPLPDGMSDLCATLPTLLADAIFDRLTRQSRTIIDARAHASEAASDSPHTVVADVRSIDEVRADVLADMLLTAAPDADPTRTDDGPGTLGAIRARVQVVVPALTLLGDDTQPADLVGRAPIDPDTARTLAGATRSPWERVLTHPVTGTVLHVDTYQRTASIDRQLRARDQHCRFPGCRLAAIRCEVDHTLDHACGGATDVRNLAHLCQRHHSMKQFTAWKVRQTGGGVLEWTSPLGRAYIDEPPSLGVHFSLPGDADPPDPVAPLSDPPF